MGSFFGKFELAVLQVADKAAAVRISNVLDVSSRLKAVRTAALREIGNRELFIQDNRLVGISEDGHPIHLLISILTTRTSWRGGWILAIVPIEDTTAFREYLGASRAAVTANLRKERAQHGSNS